MGDELDEDEGGIAFRAGGSGSGSETGSVMTGVFPGERRPRRPDPALVIDGKTLGYALDQNLEQDFLRLAKHCESVLCCRATPFQKVSERGCGWGK